MPLSETVTLARHPLLVTLALTVTARDLRHRSGKSLTQMSPAKPCDIGCDATRARVEAAKPFWRA